MTFILIGIALMELTVIMIEILIIRWLFRVNRGSRRAMIDMRASIVRLKAQIDLRDRKIAKLEAEPVAKECTITDAEWPELFG